MKTQYKIVSKERNELRRNKLINRNNNEEVIKTKSKAKNKKVEELPCMNTDCDNQNEEALIKCNACAKWICESCSDIAIPKLKPFMNKCATLYFVCKNCVSMTSDGGALCIQPLESEELDVPNNTPSDDSSNNNIQHFCANEYRK